MKVRSVVFILTAFLVFALGGILQAANIEKGPYLIYPDNNTQMTVLYQLDASSSCTLEWGTNTTYSDGNVQTTEYGSDHQHKYVIPNLTPGTKYYYRVNVSGSYYTGTFWAAPATSAVDVKFLAYGDTRSYPADHDSVCAQMIDTYTNDPGYQTFTAHVGDWVNDGDQENDWTTEFFPRSRANLIGMQANLPIMGCMGNHEGSGVLYQKYYPYPFVADRYFSFDYGPAHVVILDQYVSYSQGSTQYNWLENDLSSTAKPWKFIVLHEPGWSAGGHSNDSTVQNDIQPLCIQYGVKLVFAGHNHYYARAEVDGVQHLTVGGGGAPLYSPSSSAANVVATAEVYHHGEIDIQGDQLSFVARDWNGNVIDSFTTTNTIEPALPWSDGFESGDTASGGWVTSGKVKIGTDSYSGTYAAYTNRIASMTKSIHTLGFSTIHVKYARKTVGLEPDEYLVAEWYDGSNWHEIERTQNTSWAYVDYELPAGAGENAQFKLRFSTLNVDSKEYTYVDQVEITGGGSTPDTTPPTPDPMTWATVPYATGSTSISMTATTAFDTSGVQYYFECTAGGGNDSVWQDSPTYEDTGLSPDTQYTYRVKARDKSSNNNETGFSGSASATTDPAGSNEMYVNDIAMSYQQKGPNYNGIAVVWIKDTNGANVSGATVYGTWSGSVSGSANGVTGTDGTISFKSPKKKNGGTFTFTVTDVVKSGYTYNDSLNVETSDSITI
ncbi:MAG: metallophosphoesterase family protein [bacterium]|nr:metallophosphoesterase family protein [bacterium]